MAVTSGYIMSFLKVNPTNKMFIVEIRGTLPLLL